MNILIIHNYYKQRGGEDAVFENESQALKKAGHEVFTYTRNNNEIDNFNILKKIGVFFSAFNNQRTKKDITNILNKHKIDIVHIHNIFPLISPVIFKIIKEYNIKIVYTFHNYRFLCPNGLFFRDNHNCMECTVKGFRSCVFYECYKNSFFFSLLYAAIMKINQKVFKNYIDCYIALTGFTKKIFIENGYDKRKIIIKDNGYTGNIKQRQVSRDYFLYMGRLSSEKGIEFLLDVFANDVNYNLYIAGTGKDSASYIAKYSSDRIYFFGFLSGDKKLEILADAAALIVPSMWYENYPISIVEAFGAGVPVIASKTGGLPYIIDNGKNGLLFEVNDKSSLVEKLQMLIENKRLTAELGRNARTKFEEKMEMSNNVQKLLEIYKDVIND